MKFLRTVSTRRLLALIAGIVIAIGAGTAIAIAASGPGPVPPPKPLAKAIHDALAAPAVTGISARISFTNNLIGSANLGETGAADPILSGATGRLWLGDHQLRLELQSDNGDAQVVINKGSFWISDPSSQTVYEGTLPTYAAGAKDKAKAADQAGNGIPTIAQIQSDLTKLMGHADVSGAIPSDVGGQAAYTVRISPKHSGSLLGDAQLAWDAIKGVPLRIAIYSANSSTPVLELKVTNISYGKVDPSVFNIAPPAGSKVVKISTAGGEKSAATAKDRLGRRAHKARAAEVSGVAAVAAKLPFKLDAPSSLAGLPRHTTTLLSMGGKPAALVTYGQNLGGIAVIEHAAPAKTSGAQSSGSNSGHSSFNLPTVSINGATGQELDTALGTMITFTRNGVSYTVVGSVLPPAADKAARAL
jgi:outer membrane lipoprotein-sorting protein